MRTIRRCTKKLNVGKQGHLHKLAKAFAKEKQHWLLVFQQTEHLSLIQDARKERDKAVKQKYTSRYGLQARMWKLALQEAADTMHKYWQSLLEQVKRNIFRNTALSGDEKHYAYWLLCQYARCQAVLEFRYLEFKDLSIQSRKKVVKYLNRQIRKYKKSVPKVKIARSFNLDENCYEVFSHHGQQYIKIMSLIPRKRICLPLLGNTPIRGNIRIVLNNSQAEVHYTANIKATQRLNQNVMALDFGYTEAFTDSEGNQYGQSLGGILTQQSDDLKDKMQMRHKLHALQKQYQQSPDPQKQAKANNIASNNLGRFKLNRQQAKTRASIDKEINTACNQVFKKPFGILVSEDLSHSFRYSKGKKWNRRFSAWVRGRLQERVAFKALVKGFDHKQVNPAYCSQTCLDCDFVGPQNRKGDRFLCQFCGYENHADVVAAINLENRYFDQEITRYTPYREVKKILLERFHRRLETLSRGTVSGRILDTTYNEPTVGGQSESEYEKRVVYV
jgi:putative transposase